MKGSKVIGQTNYKLNKKIFCMGPLLALGPGAMHRLHRLHRTYVMCVTVAILWCSEDETLTIVIQPSLTAFRIIVTKYNLLIRHRAILKAMYFYW